jgi:hypothetical protein
LCTMMPMRSPRCTPRGSAAQDVRMIRVHLNCELDCAAPDYARPIVDVRPGQTLMSVLSRGQDRRSLMDPSQENSMHHVSDPGTAEIVAPSPPDIDEDESSSVPTEAGSSIGADAGYVARPAALRHTWPPPT